ncbi:MAG: aminotransferase class V-fold PLP-dependent enzyme [Acidiferrobacterales bacterium]|nr:aminotransferase class V-fold PLP-dependent enzyme [Acidiferrobacterales bacterium]
MVFDTQLARRDTPGCLGVVHLHHSGSAMMPIPVIDAFRGHIELETIRGGYEAEEEAKEKLNAVYSSIGSMINCSSNEIALTESATVAWNAVFYGIAQTLKPGDRILTSKSEYVSNMIAYFQVAERTGAQVEVVPDDDTGQLDVRALESMINNRVRLISVTHVPTHNGLVNPINDIGQVASDYNIPYIVDACQSAGQMPLDVTQIGCDALSATGRKFLRAPRGTGFLYVREQMLERFPPVTLDLHAATWTGPQTYELQAGARRYEMFESNIAARIGLGAAVDYAMSWGLADIYSRIRFLADRLREQLGLIERVTLRDKGKEKCGIVTFTLDGINAEEFQQLMRKKNINVGVSKRNCALTDLEEWGLDSLIRSPVHYYNSDDEIEFFVNEVKKLAESLS